MINNKTFYDFLLINSNYKTNNVMKIKHLKYFKF